MSKPREFYGTEWDHGHFIPVKPENEWVKDHWKDWVHVIEYSAFEEAKKYKAHYDRLFASGVLIPTEEFSKLIDERDQLKASEHRKKAIILQVEAERDQLKAELDQLKKENKELAINLTRALVKVGLVEGGVPLKFANIALGDTAKVGEEK